MGDHGGEGEVGKKVGKIKGLQGLPSGLAKKIHGGGISITINLNLGGGPKDTSQVSPLGHSVNTKGVSVNRMNPTNVLAQGLVANQNPAIKSNMEKLLSS